MEWRKQDDIDYFASRKERFREMFHVQGMESKRLKGGTWAYRLVMEAQ